MKKLIKGAGTLATITTLIERVTLKSSIDNVIIKIFGDNHETLATHILSRGKNFIFDSPVDLKNIEIYNLDNKDFEVEWTINA